MAEKKFTLFEVHLGNGDVQFGPSSIGDTGEDVEVDFDTDADVSDESSGGKRLLPVVLGLVVLVGVALVAKKFLGGSDMEELEELDELAAEA